MNYGYVDEKEVVQSGGGLRFGLNEKVRLARFEYITNGGAGGTAGEALEIVFKMGESEKSYRKFPVTQAYDKKNNNTVVTEPTHPAMIEAGKQFSAVISQLLVCFIPEADVIRAFGQPINSFKDYCDIAQALLPANYSDIDLDLFAQYQWNIADGKTQSYLEIPKDMSQGKFLVAHKNPVGKWTEDRGDGLHYKDDAANVHPFGRSQWFMDSNWGKQQGGNAQAAKANVDKAQGGTATTTTTSSNW